MAKRIKKFFILKMINIIKRKLKCFPNFVRFTSNWLPIIGYTLAISGFLNLLEYFSPEVLLNVIRTSNINHRLSIDSLKGSHYQNTNHYYDINDFRNFYRDNNLPIPKIGKSIPIMKSIFYPTIEDLENERTEDLYKYYNTASPDLVLIRSIYYLKDFDSAFIRFRIKSIDKQFNSIQWRKTSSIRRYPHDPLNSYTKSIREIFKKYSSDIEYYTFLCAILYSRKVENEIYIENKSEISLFDIKILIPSPESKLTDRSDYNILNVEYDLIPNIIYYTNREGNSLVLDIPIMKPNDFLNLRVLTRENEILNSDMVTTYKEKYSIKQNKAFKITLLVFVSLFTLQFLLFQGDQKKVKQIEKPPKE